jgi:hypothetical protein
MSVEVVVPEPSLCFDTDSCSCAHRCWRLQAFCLHRLSIINAWSPCTQHHVCQDIENNAYAERDNRSAGYPQLSKATPLSQRTAHRRPQAIDHYLAQDKVEDLCQQLACAKSCSTSGGIAMMLTILPGPRNGLHDPSTPRPERQNTFHGPSCPCTSRYATTAQVAPPPSYRRWSSKVSSPCPHAAPLTVLYTAITRR